MSRNRLRIDGLDELRAALRSLPAELTTEAGRIVESAANGAAVAVRTGYADHRRSGALQDSVDVEPQNAGQFGAARRVIAKSPHAWLFEHGSQARHTAIGANRGSMPATPTFVPAIVRARRTMYEELKRLLERNGLRVSGDAG